jgi:hypothetical protein
MLTLLALVLAACRPVHSASGSRMTEAMGAPEDGRPIGNARVFERINYIAERGRLGDLHEYLGQRMLPLMARYGVKIIGAWVPYKNDNEQVYVLVEYPYDREATWAAIVGDPEFDAVKRSAFEVLALKEEFPLRLAAGTDLDARPAASPRTFELDIRPDAPSLTPMPTRGSTIVARFESVKPGDNGLAVFAYDDSTMGATVDRPGQVIVRPAPYSPLK